MGSFFSPYTSQIPYRSVFKKGVRTSLQQKFLLCPQTTMEFSANTGIRHTSNSEATVFRGSIASAATLINLLVKKLYTNPALAAVREILANAVDAHAMVGRTDLPVSLVLPTKSEPVCIIRDHGPGMPKRLFTDHYLCIGDSSKTNDVNQIGGMGIGCKSPLAYTSLFRVVVVFQGKRSQYTVKLLEDGNIGGQEDYCVDHHDPEWTSGMQIEIPVKLADVDQFQAIGTMVSRWYAVTPIIENLRNPALMAPLAYEYELPASHFQGNPKVDALIANNCNPWASAPLLIQMGGLVYPVPAKELGAISQFTPLTFKLLSNLSGVHHAPLGAVTMAPNRESLDLSPTTVTYLANFADQVIEELVQPILAVLEEEDTLSSFEFARKLYVAAVRPRALLQTDYSYRNQSCPEWISFCKIATSLAALKTGKPARDHVSLALSARNSVLAVPRALGKFGTASIQLTACSSISNRGAFRPYKAEINHAGDLVTSRGGTSSYTLDINKPFHLVYVDCTHAATRIKDLLSVSNAPNVLLIQTRPSVVKDKALAYAQAEQTAQAIANLHEFRGITPVALSSITADPSRPRGTTLRGKAAAGMTWEELYGANDIEQLDLSGASLELLSTSLGAIAADSDPEHTLYFVHNTRGYRHMQTNAFTNESETFEFVGSSAPDQLKSFIYLYEFVHGVAPTVIIAPSQAKANRFKFEEQGIRPAIPAFLELGKLACESCDLTELLRIQPPPYLFASTSTYRITKLAEVLRNIKTSSPSYVPPTPLIALVVDAVRELDKQIDANNELHNLFDTEDTSKIADLNIQQKVNEYQKIRRILVALRTTPTDSLPPGFTTTPSENLSAAQRIIAALDNITEEKLFQFVNWSNLLQQKQDSLYTTFLHFCLKTDPQLIHALQAELPSVLPAPVVSSCSCDME